MNKNFTTTISSYVVSVLCILAILFMYERKDFVRDVPIKFMYYTKVDKHDAVLVKYLRATVFSQIKRFIVDGQAEVFLVYDPIVTPFLRDFDISVNDYILDEFIKTNPECNLLPSVCLIKIPNNLITGEVVSFKLSDEYYKIIERDSFIGIVFIFNKHNIRF